MIRILYVAGIANYSLSLIPEIRESSSLMADRLAARMLFGQA
jgi:hypothetical protein